MEALREDWFMHGTLDFEYKKYVLLAYLQHVSKEFAAYRLYPPLADLIAHRQTLLDYQERRQKLEEQFPKSLNREAFRRLQLSYNKEVQEHDSLLELDSIVAYALPRIQSNLDQGIDRYSEIEHTVVIEPVGIRPIYNREGYLFIRQEPDPEIRIYEYKLIYREHPGGNLHGIHVGYLDAQTLTLAHTCEHIKLQLSRQRQHLPNPATYLVRASIRYPQEEAILPVVKRKMLTLLRE